jgi:cyclopropane fatty-acyl-phospholipid synthase-like methyltransferase
MLELLWNAPVSESKMSEIIEVLELRPDQSVLDVGCGCGEFLIRLHERFRIPGVGVDVSAITSVRPISAGRGVSTRKRFAS